MEPNEALKHFGVLSVAVIICGLIYIVHKWPQGPSRTFSQHIASSKQGITFYIAFFSLVLPLMLVFFLGWFVPTFNLPIWFSLAIVASAVMQYLCALIPETGGKKTRYHRAFAFLSADLLLIPIICLVFADTLSFAARAVSLVATVIMASIITGLIINKGEHKHILPLQASYFAVFFTAILWATYW